MEYCLYRTKNLKNGKYYYGVHSSKDLSKDSYLGSGRRLRLAIQKYGKESFVREDLEYFDSLQEAYVREAEILTPGVLSDPNCYNEKYGGEGGQKDTVTINNGLEEIRVFRENVQQFLDEGWHRGWLPSHSTNSGAARKGKCPVYRGNELRRVPKEDLPEYLADGWLRGFPEYYHELLKRARKARPEMSVETKQKISNTLKGHQISEESRQKIRESLTGRVGPNLGRHWSPETLEKMRKAKVGKPTHNSGKVCVSKEGEILYIPKVQLQQYVQDGWIRGRKG